MSRTFHRRSPGVRRLLLAFASIAAFSIQLAGVAAAADPVCASLDEWLPADVIGFVRVRDAGENIAKLFASDLRAKVESTTIGKKLLADEKYRRFIDELERFEKATGREPLDVAKDLLGKEVIAGARLAFSGPQVIVLARSRGKERLAAALADVKKAVIDRARLWPFSEVAASDGASIQGAENIAFTTIGEVLVASNSAEAVQLVLDLAARKSSASVAASETFAPVLGDDDGSQLAFAVVRPQYIPNYRIPEKAENFVGGLFLGAWQGALRESDLLRAGISATKDGVSLSFRSKVRGGDLERRFPSFFPSVLPSSLLARLEKRGALVALQVHRDFASWWNQGEDLVESDGVGEMRSFSQIMDIVFGRSFEDEVLPQLLPTLTLVGFNQQYDDLGDKPQPAIPGFAGILEMKDPEPFSRNLRVALQTIIGIINADMAQKDKGEGMLLVESEKIADVTFHTVSRAQSAKVEKPGIELNFSPSLAIVGKRVILSSSKELGRLLVEELSALGAEDEGAPQSPKDRLAISARRLEAILRDNYEVIVAKSMIDKGVGRDEAKAELDAGLELLDLFRDLRVEGEIRDGDLRLEIELRRGGDRESGSPARL